MNSPWYESQLIGVVLGAILGFLFSFVPERLVERRKTRILLRALKTEVDLITRDKAERIPIYENYLRTLESGGVCTLYASGRTSDSVYRSNTGSIGVLPESIVADLVAFYDKVAQFQARVGAVQSVLDRYNVRADAALDTTFIIQMFEKTITLMEEIVHSGKKLSPTLG